MVSESEAWVRVLVREFGSEEEAKEFLRQRLEAGDFAHYMVVGESDVFGRVVWRVYRVEEAKKHEVFRDLVKVPPKGTLIPYVEAAKSKPLTELLGVAVPPPMPKEEFFKIYNEKLDAEIKHFIEGFKPGLRGELHYIAPEREEEIAAKFTPELVKEKYKAEIEADRETAYNSYLTFAKHGKGDKFISDYVWLPKRLHSFAGDLVTKAERQLREEAKKGYAPLKYEPGSWVKVKWLRYPQLVVEVTPEGYYRVWDEWEIKWHEVSLEGIERPVKPDPKASTGSPEEMASRIVDVKELLESLKRGHERKKKVKIRYATSEMGGVYIVNVDGEEITARDVPSLVHSLLGYGVLSDEIEKKLIDIKTLGFGEELTIDPEPSWIPYRRYFSWAREKAEKEAEAVRTMGYEVKIVKEDDMWQIYIRKS